MFKHRGFCIIAMLLIILIVSSGVSAAELADISGHWAEDDVRELVGMGAITGYPDGTYRPQNTITRAEFASVLRGALGLEEVSETTFSDTISHWGGKRIEALVQAGIIDTGLYGANYNPNGTIKREEIAMMTVRMLHERTDATDIPFADKSLISTGFGQYVAEAFAKRIITGYPDDTFRPKGTATRAEAAVMAIRALRILGAVEASAPEIVSFSANFESLNVGEAAVLSWEVSGASSITIDQGVGSVTPYGMFEVFPTETTAYTLTAVNDVGSSSSSITIIIAPVLETLPLEIMPPLFDGVIIFPPTITFFKVNKQILPHSESAVLSWEVSGDATVIIEPLIGAVGKSGSFAVSPTENTTYTLTATNSRGSVSKTVKVNVSKKLIIQPGPEEGMDTFVLSNNKGRNYKTWHALLIGRVEPPNYFGRALVKFDLGAVPNDAVIVSAKVSLYMGYGSTQKSLIILAHQINGPWNHNSVTWNNQPQYKIVPESGASVTTGVPGWTSWDIKNLAQGWVSGSIENNGLLLKKNNETEITIAEQNAIYRSSRTLSTALRPWIGITYYVP